MPIIIDEKKLINDNIFKYEKRMSSKNIKYTDKSPFYVTYYHINDKKTTVDIGFNNVEAWYGKKSPIRYNKVKGLPMYGLDPIILNLEDNEQGLDISYNGDAYLLPRTIKPLQHDVFTIEHLDRRYVFRVIEVQYDSIKNNNFYKVSFKLDNVDIDVIQSIENQVVENYVCIYSNIGTEDECIIKEEHYTKISEIKKMTDEILNTYKTIYYSQRYNVFICDSYKHANSKLFDPLQSHFINKHNLMKIENSYDSLYLSEGFEDNKRKIKYEKSIYRFIERRRLEGLDNFKYKLNNALDYRDSCFYNWRDESIKIMDIPVEFDIQYGEEFFTDYMIDFIRLNAPEKKDEFKFILLLRKFIRQDKLDIYDIPSDLYEDLLKLNGNEEMFLFTPIILYIIKVIVSEFLKEKTE